MLRDLLRKELSSSEPVKIAKDELELMTEEISQAVAWCSVNPLPESCMNLYRTLEELFKGLARSRFIKSLTKQSPQSLDHRFFRTVDDLLVRYYRILVSGLTTPELEVPVIISKGLEVRGRVRDRGVVIYLHLLEALLLENLGIVEILVPVP